MGRENKEVSIQFFYIHRHMPNHLSAINKHQRSNFVSFFYYLFNWVNYPKRIRNMAHPYDACAVVQAFGKLVNEHLASHTLKDILENERPSSMLAFDI